ncbi:hypothetical protein V6M85_06740 [Sulfolobus tengchongensis]|uniref:Uncharacterized protein n=1 Tax=Sulfolobus tengchongensis TaxID=207809 RepID=A0AAX4KYY0_9CREN
MLLQYTNGMILSQGITLCKVTVDRSEVRVEGNYNLLLKRKGFSSNDYEIYQYGSKVGEVNDLNVKYSIFNFIVSKPQLVAFIRGYQDSVKIFTTGNTEVGEVKRAQNGLEGYLNDAYDPYVMIIYLVLLSRYINVVPYPRYRRGRISRYRGIFYFIPLLLILVYLIPLPFYIDLAIYVILLILFYYLFIIRGISRSRRSINIF